MINSDGSNNILNDKKDRDETVRLRKQWLPTHYDCEICHPGNSLKTIFDTIG